MNLLLSQKAYFLKPRSGDTSPNWIDEKILLSSFYNVAQDHTLLVNGRCRNQTHVS